MLHLAVIIASTRPGRVGKPVADWFYEHAQQHGKFNVELADLLEVNLPLFNEPAHPRLKQYQHEHTKKWSAIVARADAFVTVTPEYNYSSPPALVNALHYLVHEWAYKPMGFVSYGGISGGIRSVQMTKQICTTLKIVPILEAVPMPMVFDHLDKTTGKFNAQKIHKDSADVMLNEIERWAVALKTLRT